MQKDVWEADTIDGFAQPVTPPKVTAPVGAVVTTTGAATASTVTYKVTWKGTTGTSGAITRYDAWSKADAGTAVAVKLASATATTFTFAAHVGHTYRFAVRATAGSHSSAIVYGAAVTPKASPVP